VQLEDNTIKINSKGEINNLNLLIQQLIKDGIEIRSVEEQAPNLETVFLTLTGRNLRD
jgi:ABC-2 type transport system ATP-binding protein